MHYHHFICYTCISSSNIFMNYFVSVFLGFSSEIQQERLIMKIV